MKHFFYAFWGDFGTPKLTQKGTQRPASGQDVCPNVKLENRPLTISISPFFKKKWSRVTRK
jgi:hypothetical protein